MTEYRAAFVSTFDVTEEAQLLEDAFLRKRLRDSAERVRQWCAMVISETDTAPSLEAMNLNLSLIAYPLAELMQYAGAVDNVRHTRIGPGKALTVERVPEKPAPRKKGRR